MADLETPPFDKRRLKRLKEAEALAKSDACLASNVDELEYAFPSAMLASLCKPGELSGAVVEGAMRKQLHDAGNPTNPVERKLHRQFFRLDLMAPLVEHAMLTNGMAGFKIIGPLAMRLNQEVRMCGEVLLETARERETLEGSHESTAEAFDPDAEDAKYLAEQGPLCEAAELAEKQAAVLGAFAEEEAEWEALTPEQQAEFIRCEREEIAHWADCSAPNPRPPKVEGHFLLFNFIRYLAYQSFSDAERKDLIKSYPSLPLGSPPTADAIGPAPAEPIPVAGDPPTGTAATAVELTADPSGEISLDENPWPLVEQSERAWKERLTKKASEADAEMALIHASYAEEESALSAEAI